MQNSWRGKPRAARVSRLSERDEAARAENAPERNETELRADARALALRRLGFREHSGQELIAWLMRKEVARELAESVVAELAASGFVNDERYARMLVRDQTLRGKGSQVIRQKLKLKGVNLENSAIKAIAQEATGQTDLEQAIAIVERRYPGASEDRSEGQRAYGALIRRGFSFDVARDAVFSRARKK